MRHVRIYKRPDRDGYWVYWREGGKQRAKALPTKALAEHYRHIKYTQLNSDVFLGTVDATWTQMRDEYLVTYDVRGLTSHAKEEAANTLSHFERLCGDLSAKYINQGRLDQFVLLRRKDGVSPYTVNKDISNLRAFVRWATKQRYLAEGLELQKLKVEAKKPKPLTAAQVQNLLISARQRSECWYIRILLMLATGLRAGDVDSLRLSDVDFETGTIDTHSRKTGKEMIGRPLHPSVVPILAHYVAELPPGQVRLTEQDSNTHKKWKPIRERAGLPNLRQQDLRVTFSSALQKKGVSLAIAQSLLEHSSPEVTAKHYTGVDDALADAVNKLPMDEWLGA